MNITNQKNAHQGQIIHQEDLTNRKPCPVKALAERVHHILRNSGINDNKIAMIYNYVRKEGIHPLNISRTGKEMVCSLGIVKKGIREHMVDTPFL